MRFSRNRSLVAIFALAVLPMLGCESTSDSSGRRNPSSKATGGDGSVFEGKPHFYAINPDHCKALGIENQVVETEVVAEGSSFKYVRKNCQRVADEIVGSKVFKSLNEKVLVLGGQIFEQLDNFPVLNVYPGDRIVAFCTGTWTKRGVFSRADGMVRAPREDEETKSENLIEAFVYGPRPVGEAMNSKYINYYFGAARWDLSDSIKYVARWVQRHKEAVNGDRSTLASYLSLGFLKPEFYISETDGSIKNGVLRVPYRDSTFLVYSSCTDYR